MQRSQQTQLQERQTNEHVSPAPIPNTVLSFVYIVKTKNHYTIFTIIIIFLQLL